MIRKHMIDVTLLSWRLCNLHLDHATFLQGLLLGMESIKSGLGFRTFAPTWRAWHILGPIRNLKMTSSGVDRLFRVDGLVALITGGGTGGS